MSTSRFLRAIVLERHNGTFILTEAELPAITAGQVLVCFSRERFTFETALQAHVAVEMGKTWERSLWKWTISPHMQDRSEGT